MRYAGVIALALTPADMPPQPEKKSMTSIGPEYRPRALSVSIKIEGDWGLAIPASAI
jgi:hypothetical protein